MHFQQIEISGLVEEVEKVHQLKMKTDVELKVNYLRKTDNSIQRSTNLMTHICPKDRLHLVSFFRPPFSFDQLLRTTNPITYIMYQSKYLIPFKEGDTCLKIIRLPSTSSGYSI